MDSNIFIKTSDNKIFEVDYGIAKCSRTIQLMLNLCFQAGATQQKVIPFKNWVHSIEFERILSWLEYHRNEIVDEMPRTGHEMHFGSGDAWTATKNPDTLECFQTQWDINFMLSMDQCTMFDFITTVRYLHIEIMVDLICAVVSTTMVEDVGIQLRLSFYTKTKLTRAEIELLCEENSWLINDLNEETSVLRRALGNEIDGDEKKEPNKRRFLDEIVESLDSDEESYTNLDYNGDHSAYDADVSNTEDDCSEFDEESDLSEIA